MPPLRCSATPGATIIEDANYTAFAEYRNSTTGIEVLNADFLVNLAQYFAGLTYNPCNITNPAELNNWTKSFPLEEWPTRNTEIFDDALAQGWDNTTPEFWAAYHQNLYCLESIKPRKVLSVHSGMGVRTSR